MYVCVCMHAMCMSLSWCVKTCLHAHTHTHTPLLHFTCLTFKLHILVADLSTHVGSEWWFRWWEAERKGERGREADQGNSETPAFSLSAGSYLLWLCRSTETWADIKSDAIKYMSTQTHKNNIHLLCPATLHRHKLITLQTESSYANGDSYVHVSL